MLYGTIFKEKKNSYHAYFSHFFSLEFSKTILTKPWFFPRVTYGKYSALLDVYPSFHSSKYSTNHDDAWWQVLHAWTLRLFHVAGELNYCYTLSFTDTPLQLRLLGNKLPLNKYSPHEVRPKPHFQPATHKNCMCFTRILPFFLYIFLFYTKVRVVSGISISFKCRSICPVQFQFDYFPKQPSINAGPLTLPWFDTTKAIPEPGTLRNSRSKTSDSLEVLCY